MYPKAKVLIVIAGSSIYEKPLYIFHNDWLMCSLDDNNLFVVDENHINLWKESQKNNNEISILRSRKR